MIVTIPSDSFFFSTSNKGLDRTYNLLNKIIRQYYHGPREDNFQNRRVHKIYLKE
jgi:hypothetical protein